jgi:hypothetical protein
METADSVNSPLSTAFWSAFESVPSGTAPFIIWKQHLDPDRQSSSDLDAFTALFLKVKPGKPLDFVPCPWKCGCHHKVVPRDNGTLAGICQCVPAKCGEYTVLPYERVTWELDWPKISQVISRAFSLQPKIVKLGLYNTLQIGSWHAPRTPTDDGGLPAVLTLATNSVEFLNIVAVLVARLARPFILFAPTAKHIGLAAQELLTNLGSAFFPMDSRSLLFSVEEMPVLESSVRSAMSIEIHTTVQPSSVGATWNDLGLTPRASEVALSRHSSENRGESQRKP